MSDCISCGQAPPPVNAERVRDRAGRLARSAALRLAIALAAAATTTLVTNAPAAPEQAALALLAGAAGWTLATATGVLVAGWHAGARRDAAADSRVSLALGSVTAAAVTPVAALGVVLVLEPLAPGPWWHSALQAALGWFVAALTAEALGALRLRALLLAPAPLGDAERAAAERGELPSERRRLLGTAAATALATAWLLALAAIPALVLVAVPLHAAIAALLARATTSAARLPAAADS